MKKINDECPFHIGKMISDFITDNGIPIELAAEKANININDFRNILSEQSTDTGTLKKVSVALNHNFMAEIAGIVEKELNGC